jgi:hypothetical protein
LAGLFSTGNVDFTCESGTTRTPFFGAEFSATPAAPRPWSRRIWVKAACGVAHDDWWAVELADDGFDLVDDRTCRAS